MSVKVFNVIESVGGNILNTNPFIVNDKDKDKEIEQQAKQLFIDLINEHTLPVTLDDSSKEYWLKKKVYVNHDYRLEIVSGYSKN
jgi:hypothetical protein